LKAKSLPIFILLLLINIISSSYFLLVIQNSFKMTPLVWLITDCSSGFGEAFVYDAISRGDKVIATGRKVETRLAHLKGTGTSIPDLDVTASQAELDAKVNEAISIYGHVDVLVNNAGYVQTGLIEAIS
jgi:NADP-dependent 3-hydroxy acid dehydrogenase YdfG